MQSLEPVWAEGCLLSQQYLQQQQRYLQYQRAQWMSFFTPRQHGTQTVLFSNANLSEGIVEVSQFRALFQDGEIVDSRYSISTPLKITLREDTASGEKIFIAKPTSGYVAGVSGYPQRDETACDRAHYIECEDLYDKNRVEEIVMREPNIRLMAEGAMLPGYECLAVARVIKSAEGLWQFDETFIADKTELRGDRGCHHWLTRLNQAIIQKKADIQQASSEGISENRGDLSLFRYVLNKHHGILKQFSEDPRQHRDHFSLILRQLHEALEGFYAHDTPCLHFSSLDYSRWVQAMVEQIILRIGAYTVKQQPVCEFVQKKEGLFECVVSENLSMKRGHYTIKIDFKEEVAENREAIFAKLKVALAEDMPHLIKAALPGMSRVLGKANDKRVLRLSLPDCTIDMKHTLAIFIPDSAPIESITLMKGDDSE